MADTADNPDNDQIPTPEWNLEDDTKPAFVMDVHESCRIAHRTHSPAVRRFLATRKRSVRKPNLTHTTCRQPALCHQPATLPAALETLHPTPVALLGFSLSHTASPPPTERDPPLSAQVSSGARELLHGQPAPQPSEQGLFPRRLRRRTARGHRRVQCRTWQRSLARLRSLSRYRPAARSLCCWLHGSLC